MNVARSAEQRSVRGSITVVVPAYNEEGVIARTVEDIVETLSSAADDFEVVVVDDGSRDCTASIVNGLRERFAMLRLVSHANNRGYGAALASGFAAATRELIFLTDGDGQFDVRELPGFLTRLETADLVIGYRRPRADPRLRRLYGWGWNMLVNSLFGYVARDADCAFKLFRRRVLCEVKIYSTGHTISPELLIKARRAGFRVAEARVTHLPRTSGEAKGARLDAVIRALCELARLRLEIARLPRRP